jgi:hypothetical protein
MMLSSSAHNVIKVGEDGVTEFWWDWILVNGRTESTDPYNDVL